MMHRTKLAPRIAYFAATALFLGYATISLSPAKESIGRRSPAIASLFSPPWFNFDATYSTGKILQFTIGMNRNELGQFLKSKYSDDATLQQGCGEVVESSSSRVRILSEEGLGLLRNKNLWCFQSPSRKLGIVFKLKNDRLAEVRIVFVRYSI